MHTSEGELYMTISTNLTDMLQLAEFEGEMLKALAWQRSGLDDLDEQILLYGELPLTMNIQINVIYNLEFGMVQNRFLGSGCDEIVESIRAMSIRLNPDLHKRISAEGRYEGLGDLEIARLEAI